MLRAAVIGGVSFNRIIQLHELPEPQPQTLFARSYYESIGATGAGKALAMHRLGFDVTLHSLLGDDDAGHRIRELFDAEGIRFLTDRDPAGTEQHLNLLDARGRRISIYTNSATFEPTIDLQRLQTMISQQNVLVLNIINYVRWLIPAARAAGLPVWCDIHDFDGQEAYHRDFIEAADYLFMSSDRLPDYRRFMQEQIGAGKRLVVCTHGSDGATALDQNGRWYEQDALSFDLVDSNGAGDSFFAGFVYGFTNGYDTQRCLQLAAISGGLAVTTRELAHPKLSPDLLETQWDHYFGV